jgi:hypothetical protein
VALAFNGKLIRNFPECKTRVGGSMEIAGCDRQCRKKNEPEAFGASWHRAGSTKRYIALTGPEWYCSGMKRVWLNKAGSFKEALDFDTAYYLGLSSEERVEGVQFLREEYFKSKGIEFREDGKRLRRVFRIIKQA